MLTENRRAEGRTDRRTERCTDGQKDMTNLTFMCPCIASVIINDDQQDAVVFDLSISSLLYKFRATLSPIIRITLLCLQLQVLSTDCCCLVSWKRYSISSTIPAPYDGRKSRPKHAQQTRKNK
jgi:hypothetical protein